MTCSDVASLRQYFARLHTVYLLRLLYDLFPFPPVLLKELLCRVSIPPRKLTDRYNGKYSCFMRCNDHVPVILAHAVISPNRYCYNGAYETVLQYKYELFVYWHKKDNMRKYSKNNILDCSNVQLPLYL